MSQISPSKVLAEVAAAVPPACRENVVIIGSLAVGYHFFQNDESKAVRTKDVDCVLEPFHAAVGAGQTITRQLLDAGWQRMLTGAHQDPGNAETPADELPAVRLYPPGVDAESEEAWFIELLTVPESAEESETNGRTSQRFGEKNIFRFFLLSVTYTLRRRACRSPTNTPGLH